MTTKFNADTSEGLKIISDNSGLIEFQSAGVTKAGVNATGLTGDASQVTALNAAAVTSGKSFTIIHASANQITWSGTIKWNGGSAPSAATAIEIYVFVSDGTNWYANQAGTGYA